MSVTIVRQIPIRDQTVRRLKAIADPLDDTYDSVISRLLDSHERALFLLNPALGSGDCAPTGQQGPSTCPKIGDDFRSEAEPPGQNLELVERVFDPFAPPNLTHTKVTSASFGGRQLTPVSWNGLLDEAVREAKRRLGSYGELRRICHMNTVEGRKTNEGYHYIQDAGVSVQGQDANDAWQCTAYIARQIGVPVDVHFSWRLKEGAVYPGSNGRLQIAGAR